MGNNNPGRFRREGREAFEPYCDPEDFCPYNGTSFWNKANKPHWMEGWKEAEEGWEIEQRAKESEHDEWMAKAYSCPWHYSDDIEENSCKAMMNECSQENCAIHYMIKGG